MKCFRCQKGIAEREHYFKFIEMKNKKEITVSFCHKLCWDEVKSGLAVNQKGMSMLNDMRAYLDKVGVERQIAV